MVALYIIAGIIAFFAVLLSFNASVRVIFDSSAKDDMNIYAKIGPYKIYISPGKPEKEKKTGKIREKKEKPVKVKEEKPKKEKEEKKYSIPEIFDFVKEIGTVLLKKSKKHFKVRIYKINVILASEEAEKTALLYGAAVQAAYYLYEFLNYNFKIRSKPDSIKIIPDFAKTKTSFEINIKFYMKLSHVLGLAVVSAMKFVKFWFRPEKTGKNETNETIETIKTKI